MPLLTIQTVREMAARMRQEQMGANPPPTLFYLQRDEDESGVSGTGRVADGVIWSTGWVSLCWRTATPSLTFYKSLDDCRAVHGHGGKTRVILCDAPGGYAEHELP